MSSIFGKLFSRKASRVTIKYQPKPLQLALKPYRHPATDGTIRYYFVTPNTYCISMTGSKTFSLHPGSNHAGHNTHSVFFITPEMITKVRLMQYAQNIAASLQVPSVQICFGDLNVTATNPRFLSCSWRKWEETSESEKLAQLCVGQTFVFEVKSSKHIVSTFIDGRYLYVHTNEGTLSWSTVPVEVNHAFFVAGTQYFVRRIRQDLIQPKPFLGISIAWNDDIYTELYVPQ